MIMRKVKEDPIDMSISAIEREIAQFPILMKKLGIGSKFHRFMKLNEHYNRMIIERTMARRIIGELCEQYYTWYVYVPCEESESLFLKDSVR